ncbi:DUF2273 domain-containing protein [Paludifilum halophilum]|uniref:DUF2273 domain-containing protein n=1 Tax=Paludifilum halophilum TaxID=1642702 RepID=A0A235BCN6_9BACL|nr:DUF2273 domain-containing protein [Paludifilum halophilum]OYD09829.1 hypothetical protein CHM34_02235 [Paludifilum halophilum]
MDQLWQTHRGRMVGIAAGVLLGFIYLIAGFWKTLVFGLFVAVGYGVGKQIDSRDDLGELLEAIVPEKWRK